MFSCQGKFEKAYEQVEIKFIKFFYISKENQVAIRFEKNGEVDPQNRKTDYRVVVDPKTSPAIREICIKGMS